MVHSIKLGAEAVWRQRLRRFSKSGLTVAGFCRSEGVSAPSFYQWRKRLAKRDGQRGRGAKRPKESFVPVRLMAAVASVQAEASVEIQLPNGVRVWVPGGDTAALRAGIQVAGQLQAATAASSRMSPIREDSRC